MSIDKAEQSLREASKAAEEAASAAVDADATVLAARANSAVGQIGYALEAVDEARAIEAEGDESEGGPE